MADQGNATAQHNCAVLLDTGDRILINESFAVHSSKLVIDTLLDQFSMQYIMIVHI
jgi:hypothetical protein